MATLERIKAELKQSREEVDLGSCYEVVEHLGVRQCALKGASHSGQETSTR